MDFGNVHFNWPLSLPFPSLTITLWDEGISDLILLRMTFGTISIAATGRILRGSPLLLEDMSTENRAIDPLSPLLYVKQVSHLSDTKYLSESKTFRSRTSKSSHSLPPKSPGSGFGTRINRLPD